MALKSQTQLGRQTHPATHGLNDLGLTKDAVFSPVKCMQVYFFHEVFFFLNMRDRDSGTRESEIILCNK